MLCRIWLTLSGPPSGEQDRSIRKNSVPSGSGPSGLHYGRNSCVPSSSDSGPSGLHYGRNDNVLPSPKETGRPPARPLPSSAADQCRLGPRDLPLSCCDVAPWVKPSIGVPIQPPTLDLHLSHDSCISPPLRGACAPRAPARPAASPRLRRAPCRRAPPPLSTRGTGNPRFRS